MFGHLIKQQKCYSIHVLMVCMLYWSVSFTVFLGQTVNLTVNAEISTEAILPCRLATYEYPGWSGLPLTPYGGLTPYNWDRSSSFFTSLTNHDRLSWAANNSDLVLSNVVRGDAGRYQCATTGVGTWTVQLNIIGM